VLDNNAVIMERRAYLSVISSMSLGAALAGCSETEDDSDTATETPEEPDLVITVENKQGEALENTLIELIEKGDSQSGDETVMAGSTDSEGRLTFGGLEEGVTYTLVASHEGYVEEETEAFEFEGDQLEASFSLPEVDETSDETPEETPDETPDESDPAAFEFTEIEPTEVSINERESVSVHTTIKNIGQQEGEAEVDISIDGNIESSQTVQLGGGQQQRIEFDVDTADIGSGDHEVTFQTKDDSISSTVTVLEESSFEFVDSMPKGESIEYDETVDITATIRNSGDVTRTETVTFTFDDEEVDTLTVTLDSGEETNLSITIDTGLYTEGHKSYTFSSRDDSISDQIFIDLTQPSDQSFSGSGAAVERDIEIEGGLTVIEASHNGESNFQVSLVPDEGFDVLFINVIGDFDGSQAELVEGGTYLLDIEADGGWSITVKQPRATSGSSPPDSFSGRGPDVVGPIEFDGTHIAEGSHSGEGNFQVRVMPMEGSFSELVFNEIGNFNGETTFSYRGLGWVDVNADGSWQIDISD